MQPDAAGGRPGGDGEGAHPGDVHEPQPGNVDHALAQ
jgi:hypothetical protein